MRAAALACVLLCGPALEARAELPEAQVLLEVLEPARAGFVPEAAPVRFALLGEGQVLAGGTSEVLMGQLGKAELAELEKRLALVRKLSLPTTVTFGPGPRRYRLRLQKGKAEVLASGDPAAAPAALQPLARLIADLAAFDHASLQPWRPGSYRVSAVEQSLPGGCRPWRLDTPLSDLLGGPRVMSADQLANWPSGAIAASVCDGSRRFAVTFRPLAPGEH